MSPHDREIQVRDQIERAIHWTNQLSSLSGRALSATDAQLRKISILLDTYFYIGDTGPLVKEYNEAVRAVEFAYLARAKNLSSIEALGRLRPSLAGDAEMTRSERDQLKTALQTAGMNSPELEALIETGTRAQIREQIPRTIAKLEGENRGHVQTIGENFSVYRVVRGHLDAILNNGDGYLMGLVDRAGHHSRGAPALASAGAEGTEGANSVRERNARVQQRINDIGARIEKVQGFLFDAEGGGNLDLAKLRRFLQGAGLFDDKIRHAMAVASAEGGSRTELVGELQLLVDRLRDARQFVREAWKLEKTLGLQTNDFVNSPHLLPSQRARPTVEEVEQLFYRSPEALRAKAERDRASQIWAAVDSTIFWGALSNVAPAVSRRFDPSGRVGKFVNLLLADLYQKQISQQHFPALLLLQRAQGSDRKLRNLLEQLTAGTKDELLVTFARRADLRELWKRLKQEAKADEAEDPLGLFARMEKAEERARGLGTVSLIDRTSYGRYLISSAVYAAIAGGVRYLFYQGDDDKKKSRKPLDSATQSKMLDDLKIVVDALKAQPDGVVPPEAQAAAQRLMELEEKLRKEK